MPFLALYFSHFFGITRTTRQNNARVGVTFPHGHKMVNRWDESWESHSHVAYVHCVLQEKAYEEKEHYSFFKNYDVFIISSLLNCPRFLNDHKIDFCLY